MVSFPLFALIVIFSGIFNSSHSATVPKDKDAGKVMLCYYGSWATYRTDIAKFDVEDIDTSLCSHIIYTFMGLKDGVVTSLDPYNDYEENWGKGSLKKFSAHAKKNGIKALLAVGGWNEGSTKYSQMASTELGRNKFADSAVEFVKKYNFDGLDLDWEYPTQRGGKPVDKENFSLLLATLSKKLHSSGLMLTVAITADPTKGLQAYDFKKVSQYADYVSLMGFDFHTATSDKVTGLTAPLHRLKGESGDKAKLNLEYSIAQCLKAGVSASKLVVGIPTYGRTYRLKYRSLHGIGAPIIANGTAGIYTREAGFLAYYEICMDSNWIEVKNAADGYVYAYYNNQWVSYDDVDTVTAKAELVKQKGLAGMMAWALESEDFRNMCGGGANPLLTAANKALGRQ